MKKKITLIELAVIYLRFAASNIWVLGDIIIGIDLVLFGAPEIPSSVKSTFVQYLDYYFLFNIWKVDESIIVIVNSIIAIITIGFIGYFMI